MSSSRGAVSVEIHATEQLKEFSHTMDKIGESAESIGTAVLILRKRLEQSLDNLDKQIRSLSDNYGEVAITLQSRSEQLPGLWLWVGVGVAVWLVLLVLVVWLLVRTRTELHKQPHTKLRRIVQKIIKNRRRKSTHHHSNRIQPTFTSIIPEQTLKRQQFAPRFQTIPEADSASLSSVSSETLQYAVSFVTDV